MPVVLDKSGLLDARVAQQVLAAYARLLGSDRLLQVERIERSRDIFASRFGPSALADNDDDDLLGLLYGVDASDNSLVQWLLKPKVGAFASAAFGPLPSRIAVGGVYFNRRKQAWMAPSKGRWIAVTDADAARIARAERDELIGAARIVAAFDGDYARLQTALDMAAPTLAATAWCHKYLCALYPQWIDSFHNPGDCRFHLDRLLVDSADAARYERASLLAGVRDALSLPHLLHLCAALIERDGERPSAYWRLDPGDGGGDSAGGAPEWSELLAAGCVALDACALTDNRVLAPLSERAASVSWRRSRPGRASESESAAETVRLADIRLRPRDVIAAVRGDTLLGVGRIVGPARVFAHDRFPIQAAVEWRVPAADDVWPAPEFDTPSAGRRERFHEIAIHLERRLLDEPVAPSSAGRTFAIDPDNWAEPDDGLVYPNAAQRRRSKAMVARHETRARETADEFAYTVSPVAPLTPLAPMAARLERILSRKGQVILYGPPGTGKSYWAELAAQELAARSWFGQSWSQLRPEQAAQIVAPDGAGAVRACCFHPAYGYEDFLEGYRPDSAADPGTAGALRFTRRDGIFKRLCIDAAARPEHGFYLLIDEINRGDVPRIFGELLAVLEKGKRGKSVLLPLSGDAFSVPDNVCILATMNTSDRSIALLDTALRRRFGFVEMAPDPQALGETIIDNLPLGRWLTALNTSLAAHLGHDSRHLQIGHAYLLRPDGSPIDSPDELADVLRDDIEPLLADFCDHDDERIRTILRDADSVRINDAGTHR